MNDDQLLFSNEELRQDIFDVIKRADERRLSIAYVGPALIQGRMDAITFADGLKGTARFVNRVAEMTLGTPSGFSLEVIAEPKAGSFEVFVRFSHALISSIEFLGQSSFWQGMEVIATLTGLNVQSVGKSLISLFKKMKGKLIDETVDLTELLSDVAEIDRTTIIRIYNDPEIQTALRAALRPLRNEGITEFQTRVDSRPVEVITKADLQAADAAELENIPTDEEKILDVEKASFKPHLAWHLSEDGRAFDAKVEDPFLWDRIASGDRFGFGDKLHVTLHTEAEREANGRLRTTRIVTKVHRIERAGGGQIEMFSEHPSDSKNSDM